MARKKKIDMVVTAPTQYAQTTSPAQWGTWGTWLGVDGPRRVQIKPGISYEVLSMTDAVLVIKHNDTGTEISVSRNLMSLV